MDAETRHTLARFLARSYVRVIRFRLHSPQRNRENGASARVQTREKGEKFLSPLRYPIDGSIDGFNL